MKKMLDLRHTLLVFLVFLLLMVGLTACVRDDWDECGLTLKLRYVYNMQQADGLSRQADAMTVWIFDEQDRLVSQIQEEKEQFGADYTIKLSHLSKGNYTFVVMARSSLNIGLMADFKIPVLQLGDALQNLTARLPRNANGVNDSRLNRFFLGARKVEVTGMRQTVTLDLLKCTNTIRVILVPMMGDDEWTAEDFDIYIEGKNGWLDYAGNPFHLDPIIYRPYYQEMNAEGLEGCLVVELNTSRLMYNLAPQLVVRNLKYDCMIFNINLTSLLSMQAIGEHQKEWNHQEYLDRQDEYALTFITDGTTWLQTKIVVNGWVLSLGCVEL